MSKWKYAENYYNKVNIRFVNEKGQTTGLKQILVRKDSKDIEKELRWQLKQWNSKCEVSLEAVKAEVVENERKTDHKIKAVQLSLF